MKQQEPKTRPKPHTKTIPLLGVMGLDDMPQTCSGHECFFKKTGFKCNRCK
jgi:hypothetical protein